MFSASQRTDAGDDMPCNDAVVSRAPTVSQEEMAENRPTLISFDEEAIQKAERYLRPDYTACIEAYIGVLKDTEQILQTASEVNEEVTHLLSQMDTLPRLDEAIEDVFAGALAIVRQKRLDAHKKELEGEKFQAARSDWKSFCAELFEATEALQNADEVDSDVGSGLVSTRPETDYTWVEDQFDRIDSVTDDGIADETRLKNLYTGAAQVRDTMSAKSRSGRGEHLWMALVDNGRKLKLQHLPSFEWTYPKFLEKELRKKLSCMALDLCLPETMGIGTSENGNATVTAPTASIPASKDDILAHFPEIHVTLHSLSGEETSALTDWMRGEFIEPKDELESPEELKDRTHFHEARMEKVLSTELLDLRKLHLDLTQDLWAVMKSHGFF